MIIFEAWGNCSYTIKWYEPRPCSYLLHVFDSTDTLVHTEICQTLHAARHDAIMWINGL